MCVVEKRGIIYMKFYIAMNTQHLIEFSFVYEFCNYNYFSWKVIIRIL